MKYFNVIIFIGLTLQGLGQYCPSLGPDQTLPCGVGSTTLTADLSQCGPGNNPNQTTNYTVANIPYIAQTNTGTQLFMTDDSQQGPFQIGFNFCFFGTTYTQFYIGSNGWISFSGGQPTTFTTQTIPTANALVPKNCIMGPWQDWHPGLGGQIRYQVQGTAPCRKLIVSWIGVPMFSCTGNQGTFHIVIHESTNYIDNYIQNKPACLQWQGGTATEGIHNAAGTIGIAVPGRNSTAWVTNNDAWRWTPSGPTVNPVLTWYQVGNPVAIGTGNSITVTPPQGGAQYTCHFVYPICNAGWSSCNAGVGLGPDTVLVIPGPPNLPPPTIFNIDPTCNSTCDGSIAISPNGGNGVTTISWNGPQTGFNPTNLCAGAYSFTIVDAAGCNVSGVVTLNNPPVPVIGPIIYSDTVCYNSPNEIYSVPLQPGYTYQWSSVGNIINGQGTESINVNWSGIGEGFIPGAIQVTGYNANNCPSLPLSIDLDIFNVLPVINPIGPFCSYDEFTTLNAIPTGGVFSGNGVIGNDFYPINAVGTNVITYVYNQSNCVFDTIINVTVYPQPTLDSISPYNPFYEICEGDSVVTLFTALSNLPGYNEWDFMDNLYQQDNFSITFEAPGMFPLSVIHYSNGCASPQQQVMITVENCPELLFYLPNAFTPDGDEHNNVFQPIFTSGFDPYNFNLKIFNRWGETIFESNNPLEYWDGTYQLSVCPAGIYTYTLQFKDINNDGKYSFGGHINLIR
jgi:gliding motility-associated-like protein